MSLPEIAIVMALSSVIVLMFYSVKKLSES